MKTRIKAFLMALLIALTMSSSVRKNTPKENLDEILLAIANSKTLTEEEKQIITNEKLISDMINYTRCDGEKLIRFNRNLDIVPFTKKEIEEEENLLGYCLNPNIHVKNYEENYTENFKDVISHEYAHLLHDKDELGEIRLLTDKSIYYGLYFPFIGEALADIVKDEYYLNKCNDDVKSDYHEVIKYTKVLMEIVGPLPVWDYYCNQNSNVFIDSIYDFLNKDEMLELINILLKHPHYDKDYLESEGYKHFEELLGVIYQNKYNSDIKDNELIQAILNDGKYERPYFNSNLINSISPFYQKPISCSSIGEASKLGHTKLYKVIYLEKEEFLNFKKSDAWKRYYQINNGTKMIIATNVNFNKETGEFTGTIKFKDIENEIDVNEAIKKSYVNVSYGAMSEEVTPKEFDENWTLVDYLVQQNADYCSLKNNQDIFYEFEIINEEGLDKSFDYSTEKLKVVESKKVFIPSITDTFPSQKIDSILTRKK